MRPIITYKLKLYQMQQQSSIKKFSFAVGAAITLAGLFVLYKNFNKVPENAGAEETEESTMAEISLDQSTKSTISSQIKHQNLDKEPVLDGNG